MIKKVTTPEYQSLTTGPEFTPKNGKTRNIFKNDQKTLKFFQELIKL